MSRFAPTTVLRGLMSSWLLAGWPTMSLPFSLSATIEGMVLYPSREGITNGFLSRTTAAQELVVPRSMPIIGPFRSGVLDFAVGREVEVVFEIAFGVGRGGGAGVTEGAVQDRIASCFSAAGGLPPSARIRSRPPSSIPS